MRVSLICNRTPLRCFLKLRYREILNLYIRMFIFVEQRALRLFCVYKKQSKTY